MNLDPGKFSISFIIPVLNGEKYIKGCLDHICSEMAPGDEIIVVDNGSTDATLAIAGSYRQVRCLSHPEVTIATLRNRGAAEAKGDIFAFIDSDCLVCPGWRRAAIEVLSDESVAATGSHYDLPDHPTWVEKAWLSARSLVATPAEYIVGGNFVLNRHAFDAVSGFNELMITDEDSDIGARLCEHGFRSINAPQIRAIHLGNAKTLGQFIRKESWHSTGISDKVTWRSMDKPMAMTLIFIACIAALMAMIPAVVLGHASPLILVALILIVPVATALYRVYQFGVYRYILEQVLLYLLFYVVRAVTLIKYVLRRKA